jgi:hypothetical protein
MACKELDMFIGCIRDWSIICTTSSICVLCPMRNRNDGDISEEKQAINTAQSML